MYGLVIEESIFMIVIEYFWEFSPNVALTKCNSHALLEGKEN